MLAPTALLVILKYSSFNQYKKIRGTKGGGVVLFSPVNLCRTTPDSGKK